MEHEAQITLVMMCYYDYTQYRNKLKQTQSTKYFFTSISKLKL